MVHTSSELRVKGNESGRIRLVQPQTASGSAEGTNQRAHAWEAGSFSVLWEDKILRIRRNARP